MNDTDVQSYKNMALGICFGAHVLTYSDLHIMLAMCILNVNPLILYTFSFSYMVGNLVVQVGLGFWPNCFNAHLDFLEP